MPGSVRCSASRTLIPPARWPALPSIAGLSICNLYLRSSHLCSTCFPGLTSSGRFEKKGWRAPWRWLLSSKVDSCTQRQVRSDFIFVGSVGVFPKILDRGFQPLFQGDSRLPSQQAAGAGNVWTAHLGVVGRQGMETYRARTPCHFGNDSSDGNDFLFPRIAEINRIMNSPVFCWCACHSGISASQQEAHQAVDKITDVAETPCLASVAVNGQFLPLQGLNDKIGNDPAIAGTHPGAVGVKYSCDPSVQAVAPVVGHRQGLRSSLGLVIHAPGTDRIYMAPVAFGLRAHFRVAVHFGSAGEQKARILG